MCIRNGVGLDSEMGGGCLGIYLDVDDLKLMLALVWCFLVA